MQKGYKLKKKQEGLSVLGRIEPLRHEKSNLCKNLINKHTNGEAINYNAKVYYKILVSFKLRFVESQYLLLSSHLKLFFFYKEFILDM